MKQCIVVDFDGVLTLSDEYPAVGVLNVPMIELMVELQRRGGTVILSTAREGEALRLALRALNFQSFHPDFVNANADYRIAMYGGDCRKVCGDIVIDDKNIGYTGNVNEYRRILLGGKR